MPSLQPHSRTTDPISSYEAFDNLEMSGKHKTDKEKVYKELKQYYRKIGLPTSAELAKWSGLDRHMVAKRLPDLYRDGLVERSVNRCRKCAVSGVTAYVWWVK